jgi:hypothetical protein
MISDQWLRRWGLFAYNTGGDVFELTQGSDSEGEEGLRMTFHTTQSGVPILDTAVIEVYNISEDTFNKLGPNKEYKRIRLEAGYRDGYYGTIFDGEIA